MKSCGPKQPFHTNAPRETYACWARDAARWHHACLEGARSWVRSRYQKNGAARVCAAPCGPGPGLDAISPTGHPKFLRLVSSRAPQASPAPPWRPGPLPGRMAALGRAAPRAASALRRCLLSRHRPALQRPLLLLRGGQQRPQAGPLTARGLQLPTQEPAVQPQGQALRPGDERPCVLDPVVPVTGRPGRHPVPWFLPVAAPLLHAPCQREPSPGTLGPAAPGLHRGHQGALAPDRTTAQLCPHPGLPGAQAGAGRHSRTQALCSGRVLPWQTSRTLAWVCGRHGVHGAPDHLLSVLSGP